MSPIAGTVLAIYTVIDGTVTVADENLTFEIGGTEITSSAITLTQAGSAAGDVDSSTPTGQNSVNAGQAIEVINDGASGNASTNCELSIVIRGSIT